jgi:hypothetical protein
MIITYEASPHALFVKKLVEQSPQSDLVGLPSRLKGTENTMPVAKSDPNRVSVEL